MAQPILATPILKGKDTERFLKDLEEVDRLMQDPIYRKKRLEYLESCEKLYLEFESRRRKRPYSVVDARLFPKQQVASSNLVKGSIIKNDNK